MSSGLLYSYICLLQYTWVHAKLEKGKMKSIRNDIREEHYVCIYLFVFKTSINFRDR